jgi:hypothetical protein
MEIKVSVSMSENIVETSVVKTGFRPQTLNDIVQVGTILHQSGNFKNSSSAQAAVARVLAGVELGLGPFQSMTNLLVIDGKVTLSASLIASMVKGSNKYDYIIDIHDETQCKLTFLQEGSPIGISEFNIEDAKTAGIYRQGSPWQKYPRNMVFARAVTNGARWYCPDVFNGPIYTPDELGAGVVIDSQGDEVYEAPYVEPPAAAVRELLATPPAAAPQPQRTFNNSSTVGEGAFGDPAANLRDDGTPWPAKPEQTECPLHPKFWFNQLGKMRNFSHPVNGGGWCNRNEALAQAPQIQTPQIQTTNEVLTLGGDEPW